MLYVTALDIPAERLSVDGLIKACKNAGYGMPHRHSNPQGGHDYFAGTGNGFAQKVAQTYPYGTRLN